MNAIFVDASALTSIIVGEDDADALADRLDAATRRLSSPIALWETTVAVARIKNVSAVLGQSEVDRFVTTLGIDIVPVDARDATAAVDAHQRYGKRSGHPAQLNMGDCFAYACAKTNRASLLYKGDDFLQTDLAA